MGIVAVIARAKKSVKTGGLPGVVEEFGGTLRSRSIPAPLRPAAKRIADLLRVPVAVSKKPVSLVEQGNFAAPHAVDAAASPQGVCPFTGAGAASSEVSAVQVEAVGIEPSVVELAVVEPAVAAPETSASALEVALDSTEDSPDETTLVDRIVLDTASELAAAAQQVETPVVAAAVETQVPETPAAVETRAVEAGAAAPAAVVVAAEPSGVAKAKIKDEKVKVEVAAKANTAKTSPRSNKNSGGKSGNKKKK